MLSAVLGMLAMLPVVFVCRWVRDGVPMTANSPSSIAESASSTIDPGTQARRARDGELSARFQSDVPINEDAVDGILTAEEFRADDESLDDGKLYAEYRRLAAEQAALRRLAMLVAGGVEPMQVFGAVAEEMRRCVPADTAGLWRFGTDREITFVAGAAHPAALTRWPVGTRTAVGGNTLAALVQRPAGPRGKTTTRTSPGRPPLVYARWACARRWGCQLSSMDAFGAWRRSVPCNPARCQPTPRCALVVSPN